MSERVVEVPWAVSRAVPPTLDVGHAESSYLCDLRGPVDGIDPRPAALPCLRRAHRGDIRSFEFGERYQTVLAISTIEHVGLEYARYGTVRDDPECGDRRALEGCVRACESGGRVLVSVPFGRPADYGWFRQYDRERLLKLTEGFDVAYQVHVAPGWDVAEPSEAEMLPYDEDGGSARAVALMTIQKGGERCD